MFLAGQRDDRHTMYKKGSAMLNALEPWHLLIIVGVLVLLFGAKRLPGTARSLGNSLRIFRTEMAQDRAEHDPAAPAPASIPTGAQPAALAPSATVAVHAQPASTSVSA
jgi:sec-independent protein translocase protein TatA